MRKTLTAALLGTALSFAMPAASQAATLVVDLANLPSFDSFLDPGNVVQTYNIGALSNVTGFSYDVTVTTVGASWLSEALIYFTDTAVTNGVIVTPGFGNNFSGSQAFSGNIDLTAEGLSFLVGADGLLRLELAEDFDDVPGAADAFLTGTLTFTYDTAQVAAVPEPATWGMMLLGFGLVGGAVRARKTAAVRA